MSAPFQFFINQSANDPGDALVASFFSTAAAGPMTIAEGDRAREVKLHFLLENPEENSSGRPFVYDDGDPSTWDIRFGAGTIKAPVNSGMLTFADIATGQTSDPFPYNASAATVQAAIRAGMATNFSQAIVTGNAGGLWKLDRGIPGPFPADITADTSGISPTGSVVEIVNTQDGTTLLNEMWDLTLTAAPAVIRTSGWTPLPEATVAVSTLTEGSANTNEVQRVTWSSDAYAGSVALSIALPHTATISSSKVGNPSVITTTADHGLQTGDSVTISGHTGSTPSINATYTVTRISATTFSIPVNVTVAGTGGTLTATLTRAVGPIPYNVSEEAFTLLLEEHPASTAGEGSFGVVRNGAGDYAITFKGALANTAIAEMTATQNLKVPVGLKGTIDCLTAGVRRILNGSRVPVRTNVEIEKSVAGVPRMVAFSDNFWIRPELLSSTPGTSDPVQGFLTYNTSTNTADLSNIAVILGMVSITTVNTPAFSLTSTGTGGGGGVLEIATTNGDFTGQLLNLTHLGNVAMSLDHDGALILGNNTPGVQFGRAADAPRLRPSGAKLELRAIDTAALAPLAVGEAEVESLIVSGAIRFDGLPTSNPMGTGLLWNDGGVLKISA